MTQLQIVNRGWNHPTTSRRRFLRVFGGVTACGALVATPLQARPQTVREIEVTNAWTKQGGGFVPPNGFVPDKKTALKVAEAILVSVYGEKQIAEEQPLKIALVDNDVWLVWGTLDPRDLGGTAVIKISKRTGKVLFLAHGQ